MAEGYFDPLPKGELDLDKIKQWVQNNVDTFRRSIAMQGTLFSADFVDGTTGWRLNPDGTAQFNEDVDIGGANTTNAQLFIHNTLQHINLLENDGTDYPNHQFIIDVQNDQGRFLWRDSSGAPVSVDAVRISQNGQWDFVTGPVLYPDGAAATPSITFRASGQQDVGLFRADTDEIGVAVGGAEVARFTASGLQQATPVSIVKARAQDFTGSGISTTEAVEMTATLNIPANWAGYDIEAMLTVDLLESGTLTAIRDIAVRLRLTNATGTILGVSDVELDHDEADRVQAPCLGYVTGQTATGNVDIVFTSQLSGDSGQASWDNGTLIVTAYRTS